MSWLRTILTVADLAVTTNNAMKLEQMRQQGEMSEAAMILLEALRGQIFHYKKSAESILAIAPQAPKVACGAMKLLEEKLADSHISVDLFPSLTDKEYVSNTILLIRNASQQLFGQLNSGEQSEVRNLLNVMKPWDEYDFYLAHFYDYQVYREAKILVGKYGSRNGLSGCLFDLGFLGLCPFVFGMSIVLLSSLMRSEEGAMLGVWIALGLVIYLGYLHRKWKKPKVYKEANQSMNQIAEKFNVSRYETLIQKFGNSKSDVERLQSEAKQVAETFFGDSSHLLT